MLKGAAEFVAGWCCFECSKSPCQLLLPITDKLLHHVFELHKQGIVVLSHIVCCNASDLCHDFGGKSEKAKANVIFRLLKSSSLNYCMGTHETQ